MTSKPLGPGDPLRLGRFELLARLGQGGQGVVYLGRGPGPGEERVAVKVLRSSVDGMELQRLGRELDAIHQVQPFVTARVIEAAAEGDRRYVVSEFIDGPSLQERVEADGPLPEGELQRLAVGTATALTAIHGAGVVHRDFLLRLVDPSAQYPHPPPRPLAPPAFPAYPAYQAYPTYPAAMPVAQGPAPATTGPTFPSDLPAGPTVPGRASGRSRRGPILAAGAAAVAVALVIGGVLLLTRPSSPGHPAATDSSGAGHPTSSGAGPTSSPPPATQAAGPATPAAFAGTWTGTATLSSTVEPGVAMRDPITFTLVAGARTAHEVNQGCVNVLTLTGATARVLTFTEPQTPSCEAGSVTFTRRGQVLAYHWLDINKLAQNNAILRKSA